MATTDDPAMLAAQRRHKHAKRAPYVYRPASALTPLQQWERHVAALLRLARAQARAQARAVTA